MPNDTCVRTHSPTYTHTCTIQYQNTHCKIRTHTFTKIVFFFFLKRTHWSYSASTLFLTLKTGGLKMVCSMSSRSFLCFSSLKISLGLIPFFFYAFHPFSSYSLPLLFLPPILSISSQRIFVSSSGMLKYTHVCDWDGTNVRYVPSLSFVYYVGSSASFTGVWHIILAAYEIIRVVPLF